MLPIPVPADGEYALVLEFLGDDIRKLAMLSEGDNVTFDKEGLNERYTYVGHVENSLGETITFTIDTVVYDCFEFTTKRTL